jgi:tRNA threonylcarbamoyladenosine biosynthesis protein TsaB
MKILGIESSGLQGSIALLQDEQLRKEINLKDGMVHGKYLAPSIKKALQSCGWRIKSINLIAVDIGPGSYTGLRIGLATAKTLAYALDIPLIGVSSLDVIAQNIPVRYDHICPVLDARWLQVYAAIYARHDKIYQRSSDYLSITPEELMRQLPEGAFLFGNGINRYRNIFTRADIKIGNPALAIPRAANVARLGRQAYLKGERADPFKLVPLYLRLTEAETKLKPQINTDKHS